MSISVNTVQYDDLVIIKGEGSVSFDDINIALKYLQNCHARGNMLWDFRKASLAPLKTEDKIAIEECSLEEITRREHSQIAIVTSGNLAYGISRMFHSYGEELPFDIHIFKTIDKALAWLGKDIYMYSLAESLVSWTDISESNQPNWFI